MNSSSGICTYLAMIRKTLFLLFIILLSGSPAFGKEEIAIVLSRAIIQYEAAATGFKQNLSGFNFHELTLESKSDHTHIIKKIQERQPVLTIAVGPEAALLLSDATISIPRAFTMILNPEKLLPTPLPFPGVSMNYSPEAVLSLIEKGFPARTKIGVFFSPETNAPLIQQYEAAARSQGLYIVPYPILSSADVRASLTTPEFYPEVLLFIPDRVVIKEKLITYVIEECLFRKIPAVGFNTWFAKNGAIVSLYLDYEEVGAQTAALASTLIQRGTVTPSVEEPQNLRVIVNTKVANKFGIVVSDTLTATADKVIK